MMTNVTSFLRFLSVAILVVTVWADESPPDQDGWEDLLLSVPDPSKLRSNLQYLTQRSHVAGTKGDYANAQFVRDKLREYGFDANIEKVRVMMSYPRQRPSLSTSFGYHAKLSEDIIPEDATSGLSSWRNHTFLAFSPSGQVTAKLVYANYGRPQDFDALEKTGIIVRGHIVLMRYGECFRGLKIMNAEQRGAVGSLIYTDPADDGFSKGPTYPQGPWRPPSSVQRGSAQFISKCAGDPWRLYARNTTRIRDENNRTLHSAKDICGYETRDLIPSHPALPLSYEDALPLLAHLGGLPAPPSFQGGLPLSYSLGPSTFDVTFQTNHSFKPRNIPNVIASFRASGNTTCARKSIILGNHRDAWVFGAVDPNSGTTSLLEVARTLQTLIQKGWKPKRDIILASWSGEEFGLLGSTAFAELKAASSLSQEAVAYLNVDIAVGGNATLNVSATHSLDTLFQQAIQRVPAPPAPTKSGSSSSSSPRKTMADVWNGHMGTLGSGSDYTAFLDRLGIASLDMSMRGSYGVYHSVYDSFSWMERECDPTFEIHQAMARLWALMAFRLASMEVLPIFMTPQADQMEKDVKLLMEEASVKFGDNKVEFFRLDEAVVEFHTAAVAIDKERTLYETNSNSLLLRTGSTHDKAVQDINRRLSLVERQFLGPGLPNRPYFRHVLQSPGYYLGYGSQAFPGIAQAIEDEDAEVTQSEIVMAAAAVTNAAMFLQNKIHAAD